MTRPPVRKRRRAQRRPAEEENALSALGISPRQQRALKVAGVTVAVVAASVLLTSVIAALGGGRGAGESGSADIGPAVPATYRGWPSPTLFAPIGDRGGDAAPLTVKEVFSAKTLKAEKLTVKLVGSTADDDCAAAVWGEELLELLADAECTQALRGLYLSGDKRYVAQYTLFNLRDVEAANGLIEQMSTLYRGGWVRAISTPGVTVPAEGYTEGSGHAMGHYAGLIWIARADGEEPTPSDDFVTLSLAVRGAEKAIYRRVVAASGSPAGAHTAVPR